jgi:hypothetical protein
VRFDPPPVGGIERATEQKERIEDVSETLHNSASMIKPKPNPSNNFSRKILLKITAGIIDHARRMSRQGLPPDLGG